MNSRALTKENKGFTIIEVMIVLAIAGLIILIVFLAVPALQRNSRNTQRKNDVAAALAALGEYAANHNGSLPATQAAWAGTATAPGPRNNAKFGYYDANNVTFANTTAAVTNAATENNILLYSNLECDATGVNGVVAGNARRYAALYAVETGSGVDRLCQEG